MKYYTIGCPMCHQIEAALKSKGIEFEKITDEDTIMDIADAHNIMSAPFAELDGEILTSADIKNKFNL